MKLNIKYTDPVLAKSVLYADALCKRHRRLAARDNQPAIAKDLGVPQSIISKLVLDKRPTTQLTRAQRAEVFERYARCQYHTQMARRYAARPTCRALSICMNTRSKIVRAHQAQRQQRRQATQPAPVHRFLTMRAPA